LASVDDMTRMSVTIQFSTGDLGGQNRGRGGAILTPNKFILTFRGSYVFANFCENRSRNATVRVLADGQTHTQTQTDFIICPMLYAIAVGQITSAKCQNSTQRDTSRLIFQF